MCSAKFKAKIIGKARLCMILLRMKPTDATRSTKKTAKSHLEVLKVGEIPAAIRDHPTSTTSHPIDSRDRLEATTTTTSLPPKEPSSSKEPHSITTTTTETLFKSTPSSTNLQTTVKPSTTQTTTTHETSTTSSDEKVSNLNMHENDAKYKQSTTTQKTNTHKLLSSSLNHDSQHTSKTATFSNSHSDKPRNFRTRKILSDALSLAPANLNERNDINKRIDRALPDLRSDESSRSSSSTSSFSFSVFLILLSLSLITCCRYL